MKIITTTIVDTDTGNATTTSITLENDVLTTINGWKDLTSPNEIVELKEKFDEISKDYSPDLGPSGWLFDSANRLLLINLLQSIEGEAITELTFGIKKEELIIGEGEINKLAIIIRPNADIDENYVIWERQPGPSGTLPNITPK
jgi:hypothetical protein